MSFFTLMVFIFSLYLSISLEEIVSTDKTTFQVISSNTDWKGNNDNSWTWEKISTNSETRTTEWLRFLPRFSSEEIPPGSQPVNMSISLNVAGVSVTLSFSLPPWHSHEINNAEFRLGTDLNSPFQSGSFSNNWHKCSENVNIENLGDSVVTCDNLTPLPSIFYPLENENTTESESETLRQMIVDPNFGLFFRSSTDRDVEIAHFQVSMERMLVNYRLGQTLNIDEEKESSNTNLVIALSVIFPVLFLLVVAALLFWFFFWRPRSRKEDNEPVYASFGDDPSINPKAQAWMKGVVTESEWEIDYSTLELKKELGKGAFGTVWLGKWRHEDVAIKMLHAQEITPALIEDFRSEARLHETLRPHKYVVSLRGVCTEKLCIVTEYLPKGNLLQYLKSNEINEDQMIRFAREIAAGMAHLHAEGIVHRDLAARNILLTEKLEVKIADFGMARVLIQEENAQQTQTTVGPIKWMAPESISRREYSFKSDVWAYGITLIEIITRNIPYPGHDALSVCLKVANNEMTHPIPEKSPSLLSPTITKCFEREPENRPSFQEILEEIGFPGSEESEQVYQNLFPQ